MPRAPQTSADAQASTPASPTPAATQPQPLTIQVPPDATPAEIYRALQTSRRVLRDQLDRTDAEREQIAQQLREPNVTGVDREGLEQQLRVLDVRLQDLRQQLADAETREATAASVPGSTTRTADQVAQDQLEIVAVVGTLITIAIAFPLAVGYARRLWKRHAVSVTLSPELQARLDTIDRAVEATAIEIERIGEGQRFVTQLLAQQPADASTARIPREVDSGR